MTARRLQRKYRRQLESPKFCAESVL